MIIKRFYCSVEGCNKSFRSEELLFNHSQAHSVRDESNEDRYQFQCDICSAHFPTKRSVSAHKRIHKATDRSLCVKKMINTLTKRLNDNQTCEMPVPIRPYTIDDAKLPPIVGPMPTTLPLFSSLFSN